MGRQGDLERRETGPRRAASTGAAALLLGILLGPDPAIAQCNPPAPASGQTVTCSGNPSSFSTTGLSTLTVNIVPGTSFNGPFSASTMSQIDVNNTFGNMQAVTFNAIGLLNFATSGNIDSGVTITNNTGTANINNQGNINQTFTISGNGNLFFINSGGLNPGIIVTGDGTHSVDLNGNAGPGGVEQTLNNLVAGQHYFLSFDLSGNPDNSIDPTREVTVTAGSTTNTFDYTIGSNTKSDMMWQSHGFEFIATITSETIDFLSGSTNCCYGIALDNVSVVALPEPAAWLMMIVGVSFLGAGLRMRRGALLASI